MATEVPFDDLPDEITSSSGLEVPADDMPEAAKKATSIMGPTAARVGGSFLGAGIGSVVPVVGTAVGGALGAAAGEGVAQLMEGEFKPAQIPLQMLMGLIPAAKIPGVTSMLGKLGIRAGEGALMGAGGTAASELVEGKLPTGKQLLTGAAVGGLVGTAAGAGEAALGRRAATAASRTVPPDDLPAAAVRASEVQPGLFDDATMASTADPRLAKIAALEAENQRMAAIAKMKPGQQGELFAQPGQKPDPLYPQSSSPNLDERQIRKMAFLARHQPEQAGAYLENILNQQRNATPMRSLEVGAKVLGVEGVERGRLSKAFDVLTSDATLPHKPTDLGLFLRKLGQNSTEMVEGFGPHGKVLVGAVRKVYDKFETQLAQFLDGPQGILHTANQLKLTPGERSNITDVMEGLAAPTNARVERLVEMMRLQRDAIAKRAAPLEIRDKVTGETIPFVPRDNYMPHFVDFDATAKDPAKLAKLMQEIQLQESVKSGKPVSMAEAQNIFNQMRRQSRQEYGNLEIARRFNFSNYEKDGIKAWSQYVEGSLKRLNEAELFGAKGENLKEIINRIGLTAGDDAAHAAQRYITQVTGVDPLTGIRNIDSNAGKIFNFVRSMQVGLKLGQAVIANASQSNMTGLVTGYTNLMKGFRELQTAGGKDFGRLAGATIEQTMRDLNEALGVGKFGGAVLKATGFSHVEQFNRMLAANSGKFFARDLVQKLMKPGLTDHARDTYTRHLRAMGVEPMDVIKRGGMMTQAEELAAGRSVIERTQFKVRPQELPLYWNGPMGRLVTQFSSFGFKAAKAMKDEVWKEVRKGNYAPLARFLVVTPFVGETIADVQSLAKGGKERPDNIIERIADNYASIGAFGLFWDAFRASSYGEVGILRRMAGPTGSDIAQLVAGIRDPKMLGKLAAQNVPVVGPMLRPTLFPPAGSQ